MSDEHDYYSDQCANCRWAEWRGGCLNKKTNEDGLDLVAANNGECKLFEAGEPQKRRPQPGDRLSVTLPLDDFNDLHTRLDAAEAALASAQAEVTQARVDARALVGMAATRAFERFAFSDVILDNADALDDASEHVDGLPDADVAAVIRRALGSMKGAPAAVNHASPQPEAALAVTRAEVAQLQADRAFLLLLTVGMIGATAVPTEPDVVRRAYDVLRAQAPRAVPDVAVADHIRAMLEQVAAEAQPALGGQARQVDDNLESKQE